MAHEHSLDDACARAALYALGTLRGDDAQEFERHLQAGCTVCSAEVDACATVALDLGRAATPLAPRASVRARLLERVAAESAFAEQGVFDTDGLRFVRSAALPWTEGRAPAVEVKTLFVDAQRGFVTKLVRMPPGSTLLPHRHADVEESFVLEGDLLVSGVLMGAGDYCRAEPGSTHTGVVTRGGCVFIAVSSQHDQPLA
ncbi:MAG TPA: cupin domain-containing protein [Candidatus Acidoferrales bacterium]|nr:cupin domain-containing protein [Candidatus Acidoferrales bacterium]